MPRAVAKLHEEFGGITATAASVIAGVNPWTSPYALYQRMIGNEPPQEQTFPMWLGSQMEGIVIRAFTKETGLKCRRPHRAVDPNFWFTTEEYGFPMGCLLDAWTLDPDKTGIEAKTASAFMSAEWEDDVPVHYLLQIQHQMACTGWGHFYAAAIVGNKFVVHRVPRDEELIALLTDKERDFYLNHLVPRVPPAVDGHESTSAAIARQWGRSTPEYVEVINDPEIERLAQVYQAQGKLIEEQKQAREETANQLKVIVEDREALVAGEYKVGWKTQTSKRVDTKALKVSEPEIWERFAYEQTSRPLKVTKTKGS
jgi:putative phage-type endonuclease